MSVINVALMSFQSFTIPTYPEPTVSIDDRASVQPNHLNIPSDANTTVSFLLLSAIRSSFYSR